MDGGPVCTSRGAWPGENQKGFAKILILELGLDRYIGVYQVRNGRSGIPGTRKDLSKPGKCPRAGSLNMCDTARAKVQTGRMAQSEQRLGWGTACEGMNSGLEISTWGIFKILR